MNEGEIQKKREGKWGEKQARINAVSPSFCLAKWLQVTIDLVHGTTHSCHHPKRHSIPLSELARNPSALHNTSFKKAQRKLMVEGVRPAECSYCWEVEDASPGSISDRFIKSTDPWSYPELERIQSLPWDQDVAPTYLEVMIDDVCNFSCMYCVADVSRSIAKEMETHGPYRVTDATHRMPFHQRPQGDNPYLAAFQKWLPEILPGLRVLRITGGEPLLSPRMDDLLSELRGGKNPGLQLIVNSHLGHAESRIDSFCARIDSLISGGHIGSFELYTSVDGAGAQAEFMRPGLSYSRLLGNIARVSGRLPQARIVVMSTFNVLSIGSFTSLLEDVRILKSRFPGVLIDISTLRDPGYLRADISDPSLLAKMRESLAFMEGSSSFSAHEVLKMSNAVTWACSTQVASEISRNRADFFSFITEFGRRKGKKFTEVFPQYRDFFLLCKGEVFGRIPDSPP